ncbi:MAG: FadR family transcriptional regulator [Leucobacter sp.]|nr:FadR family transcriptional regulator [Leucobacter sp.]
MSADPAAAPAVPTTAPSPLAFTPITTRDVSEQVILELVNSIRRAELEPGDRLPNLPELAAELGVARDNARRALHALAREGVVEIRPGRYGGTVMRDRSGIPRALERVLGPSLTAAGAWEHLIEARRLLQSAAARLLATTGNPRGLARLERHLSDMRAHVAGDAYSAALYDGIELACATAVHCGNPVIGDMLLRVMDRLSVLGVMMRIDRDSGVEVVTGSLDAQERLVDAIRAGDGAGIDAAMAEQLRLTTRVVDETRASG